MDQDLIGQFDYEGMYIDEDDDMELALHTKPLTSNPTAVLQRLTMLNERITVIQQEMLDMFTDITESLPDHIQSALVGDVLLAWLDENNMMVEGSSSHIAFSNASKGVEVISNSLEPSSSTAHRRLRNTDSIVSIK